MSMKCYAKNIHTSLLFSNSYYLIVINLCKNYFLQKDFPAFANIVMDLLR